MEQALGDAASHLGDSLAPDEKEEKNPKSLPGPSNKTMIQAQMEEEQGIPQTNVRRRMEWPSQSPDQSAGEFVALHQSSSEKTAKGKVWS